MLAVAVISRSRSLSSLRSSYSLSPSSTARVHRLALEAPARRRRHQSPPSPSSADFFMAHLFHDFIWLKSESIRAFIFCVVLSKQRGAARHFHTNLDTPRNNKSDIFVVSSLWRNLLDPIINKGLLISSRVLYREQCAVFITRKIGSLTQPGTFDLQTNQLKEYPVEACSLRLSVLDLSNNSLSGLPPEICKYAHCVCRGGAMRDFGVDEDVENDDDYGDC